MSTFYRLIPVLILAGFVLLFAGCPSPPSQKIEAFHVEGRNYIVMIGDTSGGQRDTVFMTLSAIGDTPGGSGLTSHTLPDCTVVTDCTYAPPYMLFMIGDTSGGGGSM
jgi:hypothetical protein